MENGTSMSKIDKFEEELNQDCDISAKDAYMRSFLNHVARIGKKTILFWKIREEVEPFI
jgi:hypothetical protein